MNEAMRPTNATINCIAIVRLNLEPCSFGNLAMIRFALISCLVIAATALLLQQSHARFEPDEPKSLAPVRRITFEDKNQLKTVTGELCAQSDTLGQLIIDSDGQLTAISPSKLKRVEELDEKLEITPAKELAAKVLLSMPTGSKFITTEHFVVCYNTSDVYARWNANLYERLYKGFYRYWKERGVELSPPRFPMVALVFESKSDYVDYATKEFDGAEHTLGYYHQSTNRLASFDLTGVEGMIPSGAKVQREELINQIFSRPEAERTVATIVHEACHQISFNSGLQVRLGDNPLWLSEGIATFFESPDFSSSTGWGGTGKVNWHNFNNLRQYSQVRPSNSLEQLLVNDDRLRSAETLTSAYAEAWGLTYYLIKSKPKQFVAYLDLIRSRSPGIQSDAKQRMDDFRACFGEDVAKLDKDFIRFMGKVR